MSCKLLHLIKQLSKLSRIKENITNVILFYIFKIIGLPVQVRDSALGLKDSVPKSDVNKEYYTQNMEKQVSV